MFALRDEDAAVDVVQEAMLKIVDRYSDRPASELPMLFAQILRNALHDHFRRQKTRSTWISYLSSFARNDDDEQGEWDIAETLSEHLPGQATPQQTLEARQDLAAIEEELQRLPPRQREAFLMRYWEGMDIAETAAAMGCTEGSVKTHCSRATHALAAALRARGITL